MQQLQATRIQREETFSGSCESDSQVVPVSSLRNKLVRFHKKKTPSVMHHVLPRMMLGTEIRIRNRANRVSVDASPAALRRSQALNAVRTSLPHVQPFPPHTTQWRICTASFLVEDEGNRTAFPPSKAILPVVRDAVPVVRGIGHGRSFSRSVRN